MIWPGSARADPGGPAKPGPRRPRRLEQVIRFEADRARSWYAAGLRLMPMLDWRSAASAGAMAGIYLRLLGHLSARPAAVLSGACRCPRRRSSWSPSRHWRGARPARRPGEPAQPSGTWPARRPGPSRPRRGTRRRPRPPRPSRQATGLRQNRPGRQVPGGRLREVPRDRPACRGHRRRAGRHHRRDPAARGRRRRHAAGGPRPGSAARPAPSPGARRSSTTASTCSCAAARPTRGCWPGSA